MVTVFVHLSVDGQEDFAKHRDVQDTLTLLKNVATTASVTVNYIYVTVKWDGLDQLVIFQTAPENRIVIIEEYAILSSILRSVSTALVPGWGLHAQTPVFMEYNHPQILEIACVKLVG